MANREEDFILHGPPLKYTAQYSSVGKFVFDRLKEDPAFVGQIEAVTGLEYNYADILDRSIRLALWFRDAGIRRGDVVTYISDNNKDSLIVLVAVLFVGAVFSAWDTFLTEDDLVYLINRLEPKIVICNTEIIAVVAKAAKVSNVNPIFVVNGNVAGFINFEDTLVHSKRKVDDFECTTVDETDVAFIACTSGTSAMAKNIEVSHRSIFILLQATLKAVEGGGDTFVTFSPLCWTRGIEASLLRFFKKARCVVAPRCEAESAWKIIEKYQVNFAMIFTYSFLRYIFYCDKIFLNYDTSSLKILIIAGAPFGPEQFKKFKEIAPPNIKLLQHYGTTETTGPVTIQTEKSTPGSCGHLLPGVSAKIIDPTTGKTISPYEQGELCFKHPNLFSRYINDPTLTNLVKDSEGWYHSGDWAYFDKNGELYVIERIKEIIDSNGVKISPTELEDILMSHPGVLRAGVIGKQISETEVHPVGFVAKAPGSNVTEKELCDYVNARVVDGKRLRGGIRFLDDLACNASGKLKRWELKKILESEDKEPIVLTDFRTI